MIASTLTVSPSAIWIAVFIIIWIEVICAAYIAYLPNQRGCVLATTCTHTTPVLDVALSIWTHINTLIPKWIQLRLDLHTKLQWIFSLAVRHAILNLILNVVLALIAAYFSTLWHRVIPFTQLHTNPFLRIIFSLFHALFTVNVHQIREISSAPIRKYTINDIIITISLTVILHTIFSVILNVVQTLLTVVIRSNGKLFWALFLTLSVL
jgi:hypothetical protein